MRDEIIPAVSFMARAGLANLRADVYRALRIQGTGIVAVVTVLEFLS